MNKEKKNVLAYDVTKFYWQELFGSQFELILQEFTEFLEKEKQSPDIKQDQWNCFLDFLRALGSNFPTGYNLDDAWPILLDEFYEWYCDKHGIKIKRPELEF